MNRHPRTLLTLLLVAVMAGTGYCVWKDTQAPPAGPQKAAPGVEAPRRGGRLTVTARAEPRSFNRLVSSNALTGIYSDPTLGKLARVNRETRELEPWLAEKWEAQRDGRTFTLTLREGLRWSDGTPFSVDDVLFTFRAVYYEKMHSVLAGSLQVNAFPRRGARHSTFAGKCLCQALDGARLWSPTAESGSPPRRATTMCRCGSWASMRRPGARW